MRFIKKFIITLFVILLLGAGAAGGRLLWQGYQIYQEVIDGEPLSDKVEEIRSKPKYTPLSQLPDTYKNAVVAVEDKRFYKHGGIDLISTGRAVFINLKEKKLAEGGSSITQQLAKNMYFSQEKTFLRKVAELFVAFELEKNYTKDEILELYVNTIYYGNGYYCVRDASNGYFGKEPEDMTDYESTLLAGIPNAPSCYAPTVSQELAARRQQQVLDRLVKCGYFTEERALETMAVGSSR